jgi:hypothetical protein
VTEAGDYRFFAGWRSDPFFFDRRGAVNNLQFTGDDYFADQDVCSIVLEVPNSALGSKDVGLWHRTLVPAHGASRGWITAERGARPLQLFLVLGLTSAERDAYLAGEPADDARFVIAFAHALEHTGGYPTAEARRWQGQCCRRSCSMIPRAQRPSRTTAARSPTTPSMPFWLSSRMGR